MPGPGTLWLINPLLPMPAFSSSRPRLALLLALLLAGHFAARGQTGVAPGATPAPAALQTAAADHASLLTRQAHRARRPGQAGPAWIVGPPVIAASQQ